MNQDDAHPDEDEDEDFAQDEAAAAAGTGAAPVTGAVEAHSVDPTGVVPPGPDQAGIYAQLAGFPADVREQVMRQLAAQRAAAEAQAAVLPDAPPSAEVCPMCFVMHGSGFWGGEFRGANAHPPPPRGLERIPWSN